MTGHGISPRRSSTSASATAIDGSGPPRSRAWRATPPTLARGRWSRCHACRGRSFARPAARRTARLITLPGGRDARSMAPRMTVSIARNSSVVRFSGGIVIMAISIRHKRLSRSAESEVVMAVDSFWPVPALLTVSSHTVRAACSSPPKLLLRCKYSGCLWGDCDRGVRDSHAIPLWSLSNSGR
jgi:hypothetical protein